MDSDFQALSLSLQKPIKKVIENANFTKYEMIIKELNTHGNNYLGKLYEIDIKGQTSDCEKEINIFVKEKIAMEKLKLLNLQTIYANEELMYKEISNIFTSLQDKANVPPEDRFKIAKAYDETNNDVIILENLRKKGFRIYGKTEHVSLKYVELGIQEMAKFHALSFVIEKEMPEYFKEKIAVLQNTYNFDEDWNELMRKVCRHAANLYDNDIKNKIENFVPVLLEKIPKYQKDKTNICSLTHGDYKKNNIMFRMVDGEPVEVVPVDYQTIDYGCPIRDLLFFIFTGTDREFRRKHLNDIKELYFESLSRFLKYFDVDVETVYPRKQFETIYTEWFDYGLMMSLFATITIFTPDTREDFANQTLNEIEYCPDRKYDYIFRGLIDDFVQWGYL